MPADIDHDRICETQDRSWTMRLLDVVRDPETEDAERDAAFSTLKVLWDHRAVAPLVSILEDRSLPDELRRGAGLVLDEIDDTTTVSQRAHWWDTGDDILRAHAIGLMGRAEADLVVSVAGDADHPLQAKALAALGADFAEAQYAGLLVDALTHDDPQVRVAAAETLIWDEWSVAEPALLEAAADEEPEVAEAALRVLAWYPTRRVLRALETLDQHEDEDVRDQAGDTFETLRDQFERAVATRDEAVRAALVDWMEAVDDLVVIADELPPEDDGDEEESAIATAAQAGSALPVGAYEIQAMLADPDGEWAERNRTLRQVDWTGHTASERDALRAEFSGHENPWIRWYSTFAFRAWGDRDALILLLLDDSADVRKEATTQLGLLDPDPALAPVLWARMLGTSGEAAEEAVGAYAVHADAVEARERLAELVRVDPRHHVRIAAADALGEMGAEATAQIASLAPLLAEPPGVNWDLHLALLEAIRDLRLAVPELETLAAVDDLEVVVAVAEARAAAAAG